MIDVFTTWDKPLKHKRGKTVLMLLSELIEPNRKPNKLWVDQEREFYNMQGWLYNNNILMYSTHNVGKPAISKILKTKIYKKMTANDRKSDLSYLNKLVDQ